MQNMDVIVNAWLAEQSSLDLVGVPYAMKIEHLIQYVFGVMVARSGEQKLHI